MAYNKPPIKKTTGFNMALKQGQAAGLTDYFFKPDSPLAEKVYRQFDTEALVEHLIPFPDHPFKAQSAEKLSELAESIRINGMLHKVLVWENPQAQGFYTILSGHNRVAAARLLGWDEISVTVLQVDESEAKFIVTDANLRQREKILPSEKAKAYAMQLEAIKQQGKRTDLAGDEKTSVQVGQKLDSRTIVAKMNEESRTQIQRHIRLLELLPALLDMVDEGIIPFVAGVDLSYLKQSEQEHVLKLLIAGSITIAMNQAALLKEEAKSATLTEQDIKRIVLNGAKQQPQTVEIEGMVGKKEKIIRETNPYSRVMTNVGKFLKKLPKDAELIDPAELEAALIKTVESLLVRIS